MRFWSFSAHCAPSGTALPAKSLGRQGTSQWWLPQRQPFGSRLFFLAVNCSSSSLPCNSRGPRASRQGSQAQEGFCGLRRVAIPLVVSIKLLIMRRRWARSEHSLIFSKSKNTWGALPPSLPPSLQENYQIADLKQAKEPLLDTARS